MNVLMVDDHGLFRSGLRFLLADLDANITFFEADNCRAALNFRDTEFALILLDLQMPGDDPRVGALEVIRSAFENAPIVVISSEEQPRVIRGAIEGGAAGFIPKTSSPKILFSALQLVLAGGTYLPTHVLRDPAATSPTTESLAVLGSGSLNGRVLEVLQRAILGKSNKVIARELQVSEGTVKAHLSTAFRILGVNNRTEAVYAAASLKGRLPT